MAFRFPFGRKRESIGFDLGARQIKIISATHGKTGIVLKNALLIPLDERLIIEGVVKDAAAVSARLLSAQAEIETLGDLRRATCVCGIGGRSLFTKFAHVPRGSKVRALEEILNDPSPSLPIDLQEGVFDLHVLDPDGATPMMKGVLVIAKKSEVTVRQDVLFEGNIPLQMMDADAFALINAFLACEGNADRGTASLIHIGHDSTLIVFLKDGEMLSARTFSLGVSRLIDEIVQSGRFGSDRGEELLRTSDLLTFYSKEYEGWLSEMAGSIGRSADAVVELEGQGLGRVFVSGGGATIANLPDALGAGLSTNVSILNPLLSLEIGGSFPQQYLDLGPLFTIAVGYAIRGGLEA